MQLTREISMELCSGSVLYPVAATRDRNPVRRKRRPSHAVDPEVPKPLLPVGDRPVLAHVMEIYADQGFTDFVLAAGYKAQLVWKFAQSPPASWHVEVVDTGEET